MRMAALFSFRTRSLHINVSSQQTTTLARKHQKQPATPEATSLTFDDYNMGAVRTFEKDAIQCIGQKLFL